MDYTNSCFDFVLKDFIMKYKVLVLLPKLRSPNSAKMYLSFNNEIYIEEI